MPKLEGLWQCIKDDVIILELSGVAGITRMVGWGMPNLSLAAQQTPTQHGSSHLAFRIQDREILIGLLWKGKWESCLPGRRADLRAAFSPLAGPFIIRRALGDQTIRELRRCWYAGGMEGDSESLADDSEQGSVRIVCRDPVWYDTTSNSITVVYDDFTHGLYSSIASVDSTDGLITSGEWYAYPQIVITGPCTSFNLESTTTGQQLRYEGDVEAGATVTLVTNPNPNPSATDNSGLDVQNYVPPGDDLGGFALWPDPLTTDGNNEWTLTVEGITVASNFVFTWEDRYLGV